MDSRWSQIKSELQKKLTPNNYGIWIDPIEYIAAENDQIDLKTPDQHFSNHLQDHFLDDIQKAVENAYGKRMKIHFLNGKKTIVFKGDKIL